MLIPINNINMQKFTRDLQYQNSQNLLKKSKKKKKYWEKTVRPYKETLKYSHIWQADAKHRFN
jgi:hypothetical protein